MSPPRIPRRGGVWLPGSQRAASPGKRCRLYRDLFAEPDSASAPLAGWLLSMIALPAHPCHWVPVPPELRRVRPIRTPFSRDSSRPLRARNGGVPSRRAHGPRHGSQTDVRTFPDDASSLPAHVWAKRFPHLLVGEHLARLASAFRRSHLQASFDKANLSNADAARGPGWTKGFVRRRVKRATGLRILTDLLSGAVRAAAAVAEGCRFPRSSVADDLLECRRRDGTPLT